VVLIVDNRTSVAECIKTLGCLTSDQIRWMFSNYTEAQLIASGWNPSALSNSDGLDETHKWNELDASCPDVEITIAGTDTVGRLSGEAEYFEKTFLKFGVEPLRNTYTSIINQNAINQFVLETPGAIAFNSYHVAELGLPNTMFVPIKSPSNQCVSPTKKTVQNLTYLPLGRLTYMYVLKSNCTALKDGLSYVEYAYSPDGQMDIENTYGVPLTEGDLAAGASEIAALYASCTSLFR
jgi:ABC-type phosphate transport system substrate-binding protein